MGSYLKKIKYIKTAHIYLREWQKWQQLLIQYINIVTLFVRETSFHPHNFHFPLVTWFLALPSDEILSRKFLSFHWLAVMWEHSQPLSCQYRCLIRKWLVLGHIIGRGKTLSIYGSAHNYTLYIWLLFRLGAEPFLLHPINLLLVIDSRIYWASFILRNDEVIT